MSAPYKVIIEAVIENTYYHYGKPDQVTAPGMRQSVESTPLGPTVGAQAGEGGGEGYPMPNVPVKLGISVKGFDRYYAVTTDANGNFSYTFTPGANEAGTYSVWAIHPDVRDRSVQSTFAIAGLSINPSSATVRMARGKTVDIPVTISNYGGGTLNGLNITTQSSTGITATVINTNDNLLTSGESHSMTLRIITASTMPDTGFATMKATTSEGLTVKLDASITLVSLIPVINTSPSYIDTGMVKGNRKIASFTISNTGQDVLRNARIEGPSTPWMTLTVNKTIGDINPGASSPVGIMLNPPDTLGQGVYDDTLVIYSDNHIPYTYHIQVTITSNSVGNVLFDILNEFMEDVPDAVITFQNQLIPELILTLKTGADGTAIQYDIPEGRYTYNISPPPGHLPYSGSFVVTPGMTTTVPVALEMNLVTISWSVEPTVIQDKYEIKISQTFETNVPTPVLVVEPPNINLPDLQPGQVFNGEFKVTNYGLIEIYDVKLEFPTSLDDYDIEVMMSAIPDKIGAMQSITVPYRITRRITTARNTTLYDEIKGYGGTSCIKTFNITAKGRCVICPNSIYQRIVEKLATFTVAVPQLCPTSVEVPNFGAGGGGIYIMPGGGQGGGGDLPGPSPTVIQPGKDCYQIAFDDFKSCVEILSLADIPIAGLFAACLCTGPGWPECVGAVVIVTEVGVLPIVAACGMDAYNVYKDCVGCDTCSVPK